MPPGQELHPVIAGDAVAILIGPDRPMPPLLGDLDPVVPVEVAILIGPDRPMPLTCGSRISPR